MGWYCLVEECCCDSHKHLASGTRRRGGVLQSELEIGPGRVARCELDDIRGGSLSFAFLTY